LRTSDEAVDWEAVKKQSFDLHLTAIPGDMGLQKASDVLILIFIQSAERVDGTQ
jgi:hypothetical protein